MSLNPERVEQKKYFILRGIILSCLRCNFKIMIDIEFENPIIDKCECCGEELMTLTGFVYQNGDAFAVYYANSVRLICQSS